MKKYRDIHALGGVITEADSDYCTIRVRLPAGEITAQKLKKIAEIADKYKTDGLHLTTRQTIELPHLVPGRLEEIAKELKMNNTPIGAEREEVVNVTACPGTRRCKFANIDSIDLAKAIDEKHFGKEIMVKTRIAVSACPNSCASERLNEIGITGVKKPVREHGLCTGCGTCTYYCKEGAITIIGGACVLDDDKCIQCGVCLQSCPFNILKSEPPAYRITIGGKRGRHPSVGRHLITVNDRDTTLEIVDMAVDWIYRNSWSGKMLGDQLDEIGYEEFRQKVHDNIDPVTIVHGY